MYRFIVLIVVAQFLVQCGVQQPQVNSLESRITTQLDSLYQSHPNAKGIMVHIYSKKSDFDYDYTKGYANYMERTPLQKNQSVLIASNTKTYVSAAILRLIEEGKLNLQQPIGSLLSSKTSELFSSDGYDLTEITVRHLLNHTSGIQDYVSDYYFEVLTNNPKHRWTRDEQLTLAITSGEPLGAAGTTFAYADANYLLLTEIIEQQTGKPFYQALRELLYFKKLGLQHTWFYTLEEYPKSALPLALQNIESENQKSLEIDPSFDLYGGGGLASNATEMALFSYYLLNGNIIKNPEVLQLIYTPSQANPKYFLGISESEFEGHKAFGHGGYWGTQTWYVPDFDIAISIIVLERDENKLRDNITQVIVKSFDAYQE